MTAPDVELRVIPDCPNRHAVLGMLRGALAAVGLPEHPVRVVEVSTQQQAEELGFIGSPTVLLDGVDPFAVPAAPPSLACRVFQTQGGLRGTPEPSAIERAVRDATGAAEG